MKPNVKHAVYTVGAWCLAIPWAALQLVASGLRQASRGLQWAADRTYSGLMHLLE